MWHEKDLTSKALSEKTFQERLARQNAYDAWAQRGRAVMNFDRETAVMRRVLLLLQDRKWQDNQQLNDVRKEVAETVLGFLKGHLQEGSVDPDIQREPGGSYTLMGHVYRAQGDIEKATGYYDKAIVVLANLVREYPNVVGNRLELALAYQNRGLHYHYSGDKEHARELFQKATDNYARSIEDCPNAVILYECPVARALNNYAWFLATCPQPVFRDPVRSVNMAQQATGLVPDLAEYWNTLGVARYRAGAWKESLTALERSCDLGNGGTAFDFYFMAMAHFQLNHKDKAEKFYEKAQADSGGSTTLIEPITHLGQEASALLGKKIEPPAKGSGKNSE